MNKPVKTPPSYGHIKAAARDNTASEPPEGRVSRTQVHAEFLSGPLPSAEELGRYEAVLPGMADRLVTLYERQFTLQEKQAEHRFDIERTVIHGDSRRSYAGLALGFLVAMAFMFGAYRLGMAGHDVLAGTLATVDVGAFVGVFVFGTESRRKERSERSKLMLAEQIQHDSKDSSAPSEQPKLPGM